MRSALYPGTFDPITLGHLDLVERSLNIFDRVIVAIATNPAKNPLFSVEDRLKMARASCKRFGERLEVVQFDGLTAPHAAELGLVAIVRGLRAISDFEFEFQMALMNRHLAPNVETVFLMPKAKFVFLNSTLIKNVARFGGNVSDFVPPEVLPFLKTRFAKSATSQ